MLRGAGGARGRPHLIVESVDDDGYLREDDATLAERCGVAAASRAADPCRDPAL